MGQIEGPLEGPLERYNLHKMFETLIGRPCSFTHFSLLRLQNAFRFNQPIRELEKQTNGVNNPDKLPSTRQKPGNKQIFSNAFGHRLIWPSPYLALLDAGLRLCFGRRKTERESSFAWAKAKAD